VPDTCVSVSAAAEAEAEREAAAARRKEMAAIDAAEDAKAAVDVAHALVEREAKWRDANDAVSVDAHGEPIAMRSDFDLPRNMRWDDDTGAVAVRFSRAPFKFTIQSW
jgi:hypothetical protein